MSFDMQNDGGGLKRKLCIDEAGLPPSRSGSNNSYTVTPYATSKMTRGVSDQVDLLSDLSKTLMKPMEAGAGTNHEPSPQCMVSEDASPTNTSPHGEEGVIGQEAADAAAHHEPDWSKIAQEEPAKTTVPLFLAARERRDEADMRLATQLDEAQVILEKAMGEIMNLVVQIHQSCREDLDRMEEEFKQTAVWNDGMRSELQGRLQEGMRAAQGIFSQLLGNLSQGAMNIFGGGQQLLLSGGNESGFPAAVNEHNSRGKEQAPK